MNAVVTPVEHFQSEFARLHGGHAGDHLRNQREAALTRFSQTGLPTTRVEEWKYTDVRPLAKRNFGHDQVNGVSADQIAELRFAEHGYHELVFINGRYDAGLSRIGDLNDGVRLQSLATALQEPAVAKRIGHCLNEATISAFTELNTAFMHDGAWIDIPDGVVLEKPIVLLYLDKPTDQPTVCHPRTLIRLGRNAGATIVESYVGLDDRSQNLTNAVTEIELADAARLDHYKIQQASLNGFHVGRIDVSQGRDTYYESHSIALGASLARTDINTQLEAAGATAILNGLYMAGGRQHTDHHTRIDHRVPHTRSEEYYRGVLDGHSRGVFNGKIIVHQDAQKTDSQMSNANLLLSAQAEVDTKPELEIYADDVKCSHGATIGQLDENALFYLRSRAIDEATARNLLTHAFASEVIQRIRLQPIRARLEHIVLGKLPQAEQIKEFAGTVEPS
jgi:Fe-S cluster assembly protein SufD